jgi:hypothetical protein
MNTDEFYNEFNLVYNNISSNQAPGLDKYEISVYLTKSQAALEDALYAEFEQSEEARRKLAPLVKTQKVDVVSIPNSNIIYPEYTTTYKSDVLNDVRYIINEQVKMSNKADRCIKEKHLRVQPVSHDEIDIIVKNPFRFNIGTALRLDTSYNNNNYIEILTKDKNIEYYQIRYLKDPDPIILDDFEERIDGVNHTVMTGSLPKETHRQIVEMAARMAYADYRQ